MDLDAALVSYCAQFFGQLFGASLGDNRKLTIFTTPDRASRRFESVESAAEYVASCSPATSVYHGLGTVDAPRGRGTADEVLSISDWTYPRKLTNDNCSDLARKRFCVRGWDDCRRASVCRVVEGGNGSSANRTGVARSDA